jgi:hypothetical protein
MRRYLTCALAAVAGLALAGCQKAAAPANNAAASPAAPVATNAAPAPAATATTATGADAADVRTYLEGLYAHYKSSKGNTFEPFGRNEGDVFDADTIALLKADEAAAHGEVGAIDSDWLCQCQDFESIQSTISVQSATPTTAAAAADFKDTQISDAKPEHITFDLVKVNGAWRIHDIHTADQPSLRKVLQDDIREMKKLPANAF